MQAVADKATAAEVVLSVDQGEVRVCPAAEVPLPVDQGGVRVSPANEVGVSVDQWDARVSPAAEVGLRVDQGDTRVSPANEVGMSVDHGDARVGAKRECTEGAELESAPSESEGAPPLKRKWLLRRKKTIGRRKDGRKVKLGTYDYLGVRESHGLAPSAPPQQVLSAVMIDQGQRQSAIVPLKSELQQDLKKALACNHKQSETI